MLRPLIVKLVCVALACMPVYPVHANPLPAQEPVDAQALQARYPHATVIQVSAEDYPALQNNLRRLGYQPQAGTAPLLLAANEPPSPAPPPAPAPQPAPQEGSTVDCDARAAQSGGGGNVGVNVNIFSGGHPGGRGSGGRGSNDGAAIILVIVGAVVLVVWTVYAIKYVADTASGRVDPCGRRWSEWAVSTTSIDSDRSQYANFFGLRYLTGVDHGGMTFGLSAELGQADVQLTEASALRLRGLYWMLGPLLRWDMSGGSNPSYFQMELVAGSTENPEMGVIAAAKLGVNFGLSDRLRLGVSYGALNMNLHEQGIIANRSRSYTVWGLDMGYRF